MFERFFYKLWFTRLEEKGAKIMMFVSILLVPISLTYLFISRLRQLLYRVGLLKSYQAKLPVVIVGNRLIGGQGKTPFTILLTNYLSEKGLKVGVISSGYKSKNRGIEPVYADSEPVLVGDEAVLIAQSTGAVVYSGRDRVEATKIISKKKIDIILHDDGLDHLALERNFEVILEKPDSVKNIISQAIPFCKYIPSGPWRAPYGSFDDSVKVNYINLNYQNYTLFNPMRNIKKSIDDFSEKKIHLVTGIATPDIIYKDLEMKDFDVDCRFYQDHYPFKGNEIIFEDEYPVFITEKDYVKLKQSISDKIWIIKREIQINDNLKYLMDAMIKL